MQADKNGPARILIVDDEQASLKFLSTLIAREGYSYDFAQDGKEALDKVQELKPDIVLLDIMMPVMDGIETCRRLKEDHETSRIPVIILTSLGDSETRLRALEAGADDFLSKPVDPSELTVRTRVHLQLREIEDSREKSGILETTVEAIKTAKREWELTLDCISDAVILLDSDDNILRCNAIVTVLTGKSYDDLIGRKWQEVFEECGFRRLLSTDESIVMQHPNGKCFDFDIAYTNIHSEKNRYIAVITLRDITERKAMEDRMLHHNEFLNNVINSFGYPFYVIDVNDYSIKIANRAALDEGFVESGRCYELTHNSPVPCCDEEHPCPVDIIRKTGKPVTVEHIHFVDGAPRYFEVHGYPVFSPEGAVIQVIEYSIDITERREAEELLRKSKEELQARHEELSRATEALEITNLQIDKDKRDLQFALDEISFFLNQVADEKDFSIRFSSIGTDVSDHAYKIGELFNNMMDILESQHKELERAYEEIKATQSQILQQEKMASIGQLAAGVAHEINNPMGFIMSNLGSLHKYVEKLSEFIKVQSEVMTMLKAAFGMERAEFAEAEHKIKESRKQLKVDYILDDLANLIKESLDGADRVKKIVQDLKNFSRIDESENKMSDINSGLDSTINIVWNELKYKVTLKKDYGSLPMTKCNPGQLNQVFMNILVNAAQAIEKQGEISVRTWTDDGRIRVSIADTGCGISADKISRIFEPFYTTKDVGKGTGLGLSIAYDIIKKHRGEIMVESEVGAGTTFTISIPVVER